MLRLISTVGVGYLLAPAVFDIFFVMVGSMLFLCS